MSHGPRRNLVCLNSQGAVEGGRLSPHVFVTFYYLYSKLWHSTWARGKKLRSVRYKVYVKQYNIYRAAAE